jgi:hypothetical protein
MGLEMLAVDRRAGLPPMALARAAVSCLNQGHRYDDAGGGSASFGVVAICGVRTIGADWKYSCAVTLANSSGEVP